MEHYFELVVAEAVPALLCLTAALDSVFLVHKIVVLSGEARRLDVLNHAVGLILIGLGWYLWRRWPRIRMGHVALFLLACLVTGIAIISYGFYPTPYFTGVVTALILSVGVVMLSFRWSAATLVLVLLGWSATALEAGDEFTVLVNECVGIFTAIVVSLFCVKVRRDIYRDQFELMEQERVHSTELGWALSATQENRAELDRQLEATRQELRRREEELEDTSAQRRLLDKQLQESKKTESLGRMAGGGGPRLQ